MQPGTLFANITNIRKMIYSVKNNIGLKVFIYKNKKDDILPSYLRAPL